MSKWEFTDNVAVQGVIDQFIGSLRLATFIRGIRRHRLNRCHIAHAYIPHEACSYNGNIPFTNSVAACAHIGVPTLCSWSQCHRSARFSNFFAYRVMVSSLCCRIDLQIKNLCEQTIGTSNTQCICVLNCSFMYVGQYLPTHISQCISGMILMTVWKGVDT